MSNIKAVARMIANMLERDLTNIRKEAAQDLLMAAASAHDRIARLEAELAEARKDQARYQFVRDMTPEDFGNMSTINEEFDSLVDEIIRIEKDHIPNVGKMVQSQAQQPNAWQQAIDDELVNAHLGIAKDGITREEAKAELNKLIAWHIDAAKYFDSQAQQEPSIEDVQQLVEASEIMLKWCVKNVQQWNFSEYDWLHHATEKVKASLPPAPEGGDK